MEKEYFVKVDVKEELPTSEGRYHVIKKIGDEGFTLLDSSKFYKGDNKFSSSHVTHWLKPISSMPEQEWVNKIEKLYQQLSYIEDIAKGDMGNLITDVRANLLNVISFLSTLPDEGEKKYSEEDMRKCFNHACAKGYLMPFDMNKEANIYLQSLNPNPQ